MANTETLSKVFTAVYQKRVIKAFFIPSPKKSGKHTLSGSGEYNSSSSLRLGVLDEEGVLQLWEWAETDYCWVALGKCSLVPNPAQLSYFVFDSVGK